MPFNETPTTYLDFNTEQTKNLNVVVQIPGLPLFTSAPLLTLIRYGDPVKYGDAFATYGGYRLWSPTDSVLGSTGFKDLLQLEGGSLTLSQRLEPEQGRGAISTISMSFIDKDNFMSEVISPKVLVNDILGKDVKVWLGYQQLSFPDDYYVVFRGIITGITSESGRVTLQFSDANIKRKQDTFLTGKTKLTAPLGGNFITDLTVSVNSNIDFHKPILGPNGSYDSTVKLYLKIDDEFILYDQSSFVGTQQLGPSGIFRGERGSLTVAHAIDAPVEAWFEISGHAIDIALKVMLSGWAGPWTSGVALGGFANTGAIPPGVLPNGILLPTKVSGRRDYGLYPGDYLTISGATNPSNNGTCRVTGFVPVYGSPDRVILTDKTFIQENPTPAVMSIRSQYDTYPITMGSKLGTDVVDVDGHIYYKDVFLAQLDNSYRFLINSQTPAKSWLESEVYLPMASYSLTRMGRLSMGLTKPPLADQRTATLDWDNVLNPQSIKMTRATNNRKFFNDILFEYDKDDAGQFTSTYHTVDSDSLNIIGQYSQLPIQTSGTRTDLGFANVVTRRTRFLLNRYGPGAVQIDLKVNWGTGNQIEAGDVIILDDSGHLQLTNFGDGTRNNQIQLYEVNNRSLDIKSGNVSLMLISGVGASVNDRYATIAPSSLISSATSSRVVIVESYGELFLGQEENKWIDYAGDTVLVHNADWSVYGSTVLLGIDPADDHALLLSPPLGFTPGAGYTIELGNYSTSTDPYFERLPKLVHAFLDPTVALTGGFSNFSFPVTAGEGVKFKPGMLITVHNPDYTGFSEDNKVATVVGDTITVTTDMGFTPNPTFTADLLGFADFVTNKSGGPYRWI